MNPSTGNSFKTLWRHGNSLEIQMRQLWLHHWCVQRARIHGATHRHGELPRLPHHTAIGCRRGHRRLSPIVQRLDGQAVPTMWQRPHRGMGHAHLPSMRRTNGSHWRQLFLDIKLRSSGPAWRIVFCWQYQGKNNMAKKKQELFANYDFILTFAANTQ